MPRERYIAFALGVAVFLMGAGYLGATQYIPIGMAAFVTVSSRTIRKASSQMISLYSLFGSALLFGLFLFIMGGPSSTITLSGSLKLIGSGLSVAIGFISFFLGLKIIGSVSSIIEIIVKKVVFSDIMKMLFPGRL